MPRVNSRERITQFLSAVSCGQSADMNEVVAVVYSELRAMAGHVSRGQHAGHTLNATALANEAYLKLFGGQPNDWESRRHFMSVAAKAMRQLLINHAENRRAAKRGGGWNRVMIDEACAVSPKGDVGVIALDEALRRLEQLHPRQAQIIELRFFGGLSIEDTARILDVSIRTVQLDWRMARAWLRRELEDHDDDVAI